MLSLLILLLNLTNHAFGENPAIKAILTNKGLQYGSHIGADWMQEKIWSMIIPDISGGVDIGIGTVHYVLDGISVSGCDVPEPSVEFYEGVGLKTGISGFSISMKGNWHTRFGIISDGGSFDLAVFNVDVTSVVQLGSDYSGHISISSENCDARISKASITFHGGASFIFQPFVTLFQDQMTALIEEKICPMVEEHVTDLDQHLAEMQVSFKVNSALVLDIPLTNPPLVESIGLGLDLKGEFYSVQSHTDPPFKAEHFDLPKDDGHMLSLGLSEFTVNSASYGYFSAGLLQAKINDSMIPKTSPFRLNTTSFGPLIPQLPKLFPNMLMELQVYARDVPMFSFQADKVTQEFPGAIKAFAIQPNASRTPLFNLNVDSIYRGMIRISEEKLQGLMKLNNFTLTLASSEVGTFQTAALEKIVKMGVEVSVLAKLNAKLEEGIALPTMHHIHLVNPVLKIQQGFVSIASDLDVKSAERESISEGIYPYQL
ncbi:bactericidal permeability-increasing protein [Coregonus clupeaformis]|uniref:bactericidal permeability-increasing protein n=1 Tax=Coregonus clupeaformis TaxID=59861 RepID=UPI001BE0D59C|nr:bactericidal permeability-increasing protein [Coregonus clupeaformis]